MSAALENLENQLELFIENVRQVKIIVSDFQPQGQTVLNNKMWVIAPHLLILLDIRKLYFHIAFRNAIVHGLQEIDKLKNQVQDVHVPLEVFE